MAASESDQSATPAPESDKVDKPEPAKEAQSESKQADQPLPDSRPGQKAETASTGAAKASEQASPPSAPEQKTEEAGESPQVELHQHHVSKLLDEVLDVPEEAIAPRRFKHPMILDLVLGIGLLLALGGFTVGLFKMYVTHSAQQSITQQNYPAAIAILKGLPLPGFFTMPGSDPQELLSQALYLDAMDKLDNNRDTDLAIQELQQIKPGSRYFDLAQELINENATPSSTFLTGGATHVETNPEKNVEKKPLLPEQPKDAVP